MEPCNLLDLRKAPLRCARSSAYLSGGVLRMSTARLPTTARRATQSRRIPRLTGPILAAECLHSTLSRSDISEQPEALLVVRGSSLAVLQRRLQEDDGADDGGTETNAYSVRGMATSTWDEHVKVDVFRGAERPQTASGTLLARPVSQPALCHSIVGSREDGGLLLVVDRGSDARAAIVDTGSWSVVERDSALDNDSSAVTCAQFLSEAVFGLGLSNGFVQVKDTRMPLSLHVKRIEAFPPTMSAPRCRARFSVPGAPDRNIRPLVTSVCPVGSAYAMFASSDGCIALFDVRGLSDGSRKHRSSSSAVLRHRLLPPPNVQTAISVAALRPVLGMQSTFALVTNNGSTACFTIQDLQRDAFMAAAPRAALSSVAPPAIPLTVPQSNILSKEDLDVIPIGRMELVQFDRAQSSGGNGPSVGDNGGAVGAPDGDWRRRLMEAADVCSAMVPTTRCMTQRITSASSVDVSSVASTATPSSREVYAASSSDDGIRGGGGNGSFPDVRVDIFQYGAFVRTEWMSMCLGAQERHALVSKRCSEMRLHIPCGVHGGLGIFADGTASTWRLET